MTSNCNLAYVDLTEAFYLIRIMKTDRKYFCFYWRGQKYQFTILIMDVQFEKSRDTIIHFNANPSLKGVAHATISR